MKKSFVFACLVLMISLPAGNAWSDTTASLKLQLEQQNGPRLSWFENWMMDCNRFRGILKKNRVIQGIPVKGGTQLEFIVTRALRFSTGQACFKKKTKTCARCDTCALRCHKKQLWVNAIRRWSLRRAILFRSHKVHGIWFTENTQLIFFADGRLQRAKLARSQPLKAEATGLSLPFPKNITIDFSKHPPFKPLKWKIPTYRIFNLGKFRCYYEDGHPGVTCRF